MTMPGASSVPRASDGCDAPGQSASRPSRIAFAAYRFHTNQYFAVRGLQECDADVAFFSLYEGATEDHSLLEPIVLGDGLPYKLALALWRRLRHLDLQEERDIRIAWGLPPLMRTWRALESYDPDAVVARASSLPYFFLAMAYARVHGKRGIIYTLGPRHTRAGLKKRILGRLLVALFDADWITHVEGDRAAFKPWNPRVHYVPLPTGRRLADAEAPQYPGGDPGSKPEQLRILSIGKFQQRKNLTMLVDAFSSAGFPRRAHLTIVGESSSPSHEEYLRVLEQKIRSSTAADRMTVRTNVPFREMDSLYRTHDLFVMPSRNEPLGVSVLEAMAYELPVICSDTAGVRWVVEQGRNGYVFRSDDLEDLIRVMMLASAPERLEAFGRRSGWIARRRHSPGRYAAAMLELSDTRREDRRTRA